MSIRAVTEHHLQTAYAAQRARQRAEFEVLRASGAFIAPEHLRPGLQASLDLVEPLQEDATSAEAA